MEDNGDTCGSTMELSDTWRQTGPCTFSPDGTMLAVAADHRLVVRDTDSCQIVQFFTCKGKISLVEWAPNSVNILCVVPSEGMVQAFSIMQTSWKCCITESSIVGLAHARWGPQSDHILTASDFQIRINVWSVISSQSVQFFGPKHVSRGLSFSSDGRYMALATRHDCKDMVSIVACDTWDVVRSFAPETHDLADVEWAPDNLRIAIWDGLLEYKVLVYSADGYCLLRYQAYAIGLGVRTAVWCPDGCLLAVGSSFDNSICILNTLTGKLAAQFEHSLLKKQQLCTTIYKEVEKPFTQADLSSLSVEGNLASSNDPVRMVDWKPRRGVEYVVVEALNSVPNERLLPEKQNLKEGAGVVSWSPDGRYMFSRSDNTPTVLWIWDMSSLTLCTLLVHKEAIRVAAWDPTSNRLALCTASSNLYFWSEDGSPSCVELPPELFGFPVMDLQWTKDGSRMLLKSKNSVCCASLPHLSVESLQDP